MKHVVEDYEFSLQNGPVIISEIRGNRIVIDGTEYVIDNATGYKDKNSEINKGDYVRGRAAPYPGALIIRYIEVLSDYERSDLEIKTVWGLYQSQDSSKMIVSLPDGDIEAQFFPGTKMSKTFYTKGTLISMDMAGSYVKTSADYPLVQSGDELTPINGIIMKRSLPRRTLKKKQMSTSSTKCLQV